MVGKRIGYGREALGAAQPDLTMVGARCCGWAGRLQRRLQPRSHRRRRACLHQHRSPPPPRVLAWSLGEALIKGKPLDAGRGPGCGRRPGGDHPGLRFGIRWALIVIGTPSGFICLWGVNGLQRMRWARTTRLDVFGRAWRAASSARSRPAFARTWAQPGRHRRRGLLDRPAGRDPDQGVPDHRVVGGRRLRRLQGRGTCWSAARAGRRRASGPRHTTAHGETAYRF